MKDFVGKTFTNNHTGETVVVSKIAKEDAFKKVAGETVRVGEAVLVYYMYDSGYKAKASTRSFLKRFSELKEN